MGQTIGRRRGQADTQFVSNNLNEEISEPRLYKFAREVDTEYYENAINHYSGFLLITDLSITPEQEISM